MWIFLALIVVPLIEIALFIEVGGLIGLWPTIAIVILTAVVGAALLRAQGLAAMAEVQERLRHGRDPGRALAHGALILVSGVVLLTPGFFTDAIGLLLLVPAVREGVISFLARRIVVATLHPGGPGSDTRRPDRPPPPGTVEGDYEVVEPGDDGDDGDAGRPRGGAASGWSDPPR